MQYGNFENLSTTGKYITKFKSYYVVWKPNKNRKYKQRGKRLNRTMQYGNEEEECHQMRNEMVFKSYYVVWKHVIDDYKIGRAHV